MTILVDFQLRSLISNGRLKVIPLMDGAIQPNSIDVRLNNQFAVYEGRYMGVKLDPYSEESTKLGLRYFTDDNILLEKGGFLLAETLEQIELPDDICATIEGKSSLARLGITVHQTGGWIDCGFKGSITLEMTNENIRPVVLRAGMPIAQLVFHQTSAGAEIPYNMKKTAKYRDQKGPTASRFHENDKQTPD
jgi:dCTP deaminase